MTERHLVTLDVVGRPATFATSHEAAWKTAVRDAIASAGVTPVPTARFSVRIVFRTGKAKSAGEQWDIDNLVKPTLDAMEGIFGLREWRGLPQPADHLVEHIDARKREVCEGEEPGATIEVWCTTT